MCRPLLNLGFFFLTPGKSWQHLKGVGDSFLPRTSYTYMWQRAWLTMMVVDGDDILLEEGAVEQVVAWRRRQKQGDRKFKKGQERLKESSEEIMVELERELHRSLRGSWQKRELRKKGELEANPLFAWKEHPRYNISWAPYFSFPSWLTLVFNYSSEYLVCWLMWTL